MSESKLIHNHLLTNENDSPLVNDGIRYDFRGDYLGFTFDGVHSSDLGIVRISDGNKYNENLTPTFSDITATVPGLDKTYYFGSNFTQATATIKFSFDSLTDTQIRKLKRLFSQKEPKDLIFDEAPYKVYNAKPQSVPTLSYLCFDENEQRICKGEGTITFVAYSPFARSRFKYLDDYTLTNIPEWKGSIDDTVVGILDNKEEWEDSSGMINSDTEISNANYQRGFYIDIYDRNSRFQLYNPGDKVASNVIIFNTINFYSGNSIYSSNKETIFFIVKNKLASDSNWYKDPKNEIGCIALDKDKIREYNINSIMIDSRRKLIYGSNYIITNDITDNGKSINIDGETLNCVYISSEQDFLKYTNNKVYNDCIKYGDFFDIPIIDNTDDSYVLAVLNPPDSKTGTINDTNTSYTTDKKVFLFYDYWYY